MMDAKGVEKLMRKSDLMVRRSLVVLYNQQTSEERQDGATIEQNNAGFNAYDAKLGSKLAQEVLAGRKLSKGDYLRVRFMLRKYASQLARLANSGVKADIEE